MIKELNKQDTSIVNLSDRSGLHLLIPNTYKEAIISPNRTDWIQAINEEITSMKTEEVFVPVFLRDALKEMPHESILGTRWIFTKKPERFKARLVARGFRQIHGINYDETFAPTPTFNSLRLLFSTACLKKWSIRAFDVKVAFLHSLIDKPVYIWPPMGMNIPKFNVLKLNKALYGTKQASRCWWLHLRAILQRIGFRNNEEDLSTYTLNQGNDQAILLNGLVGISIKETEDGFKFYQPNLIDKLTNLAPSKIIAKTPLPPNCQLESKYSAARFSLNTDQSHWKALEHLIAYLRGTREMGILINKMNVSSQLKCFVDASWGGEGNRSTHGYVIMHGINPIGWQSKRQSTIASSTAQSEYMALSFAAKEVLWIYHLFVGILQNPIAILLSDNRTAVGISTDLMNRKQTHHLIWDFNTINEFIATHKLKLEWVSTNEQLGDILTKSLGSMKHASFISQLNVL
ncbi:hypothetical protein O181_078440 [Austropuccinia psidii MF-1]|uniref:Reverse transcriptase Ty1/copia-type domain-containing protein n=1 Tax=Austropuccinia psidii MF-1 TaxID=1389203 RepID=A0A9Q3FCU4_9BASI|nr:hypothetical protein [Austropuccinia psidii MF-1]